MNEVDQEFLPLPRYAWEERPSTMPLEVEEVATALYLAGGVLDQAADKLKVPPLKLVRFIGRHKRLQRLHAELASLLHDRVHAEYKRAFDSDDDRRREWAASKVANTKAFQAHPLAPNSTNVTGINGPSITGPNRIVISWEDAAAIPDPMQSAGLIEHEP